MLTPPFKPRLYLIEDPSSLEMSEVEARDMGIRERYKSDKSYDHINTKSSIFELFLPNLWSQYQIAN